MTFLLLDLSKVVKGVFEIKGKKSSNFIFSQLSLKGEGEVSLT